MKKMIGYFISVLLVSSLSVAAEKNEKNAGAEQRKPSAAISPTDIAKKHMDIADLYSQAFNNDQQCEFEAYDSDILTNLDKALSIDPNLKSQVPASVRQAVGSRLGFKMIMDNVVMSEKSLHGVRMFVVAPTTMLSGVIDFKSDKTFVESKTVWDEATEDFKPVTTKGTWSFVSQGTKDRKFPSVALTFPRKKGTKTYSYTIVPESVGSFYLVYGNKGKKLGYGDTPQYADSGYTSNDVNACSH
ncbi:hypothetical protein [Bdellovibrio sp. HCB337]|uniref:hypothetical protein n=1 Tax=Bdellovibrio sp. HCB337 TaxID=3394358 RepID=UPI0039A5C448